MSEARFASAAEARKAKWFSRRHETSQPHFDSQKRYNERQAAKGARAQQQAAATKVYITKGEEL